MAILVLFLFGFLGSVCGHIFDHIPEPDECELGIITCQPLQRTLTTTKHNAVLFETEYQLNEQCRKQVGFNKCVQVAKENCDKVGTSRLAKTMLENRSFSKKLCAQVTAWKRMYLENANCINKFAARLLAACETALQRSGKDPNAADIGEMCRHQDTLLDCQIDKYEYICGPIAAELYKKLMLLHGREYLCHNSVVPENEDKFLDPKIIFVGGKLEQFVGDLSNPATVLDMIVNTHETSDPRFDESIRRYLIVADDGFVIIDEADSKLLFTTGLQVEIVKTPRPSAKLNYSKAKIPRSALLRSHLKYEEPTKKQQLFNSSKYDSSVEAEALGEITKQQQNATFTVFQILNNGSALNLGSGQVTVNWYPEYCISNNLFCSWIDKLSSSRLFKCAIYIEPVCSTEANYFTVVHNLLVNKTWMAPIVLHKPSIKLESINPRNPVSANYKPCQEGILPIPLDAKYNNVYLTENLSLFSAYGEKDSNLVHDIHRMGSIEWQEESVHVKKRSELPPVEISTLIYEHLDGLVEVSNDKTANTNYALEDLEYHDVDERLHVKGEILLNHPPLQESLNPFDRQYLSRMGDMIDALTSKSDFLLQTEHLQSKEAKDEAELFSSSGKSSCEKVDVCEKSHPESCLRQDLCKEFTENKYKPGTYVYLRDIEVVDPLNLLNIRNNNAETNYVVVGKPYLPEESEVESCARISEIDVDTSNEETTIAYSIEDFLENLVPEVNEEKEHQRF